MKVDCEHNGWKEITVYTADSSYIYHTAEIQKDSLHISLSSSYSIIQSSKHGNGASIAIGPPLLPIFYFGGSVSHDVLENGFALTLRIQYAGVSSYIDFSKSKIVLPNQREYKSTKLGRYERRHPFHYLESSVISPTTEENMYKIEFELTNSEILDSCERIQIVFPTLIKLSGDSIQIPTIDLVKDHNFKYYPFIMAG